MEIYRKNTLEKDRNEKRMLKDLDKISRLCARKDNSC